MIVTEELTVRNMTASARGTVEEPGRNLAQKAGLNRSILDTAPAMFLNMLRHKAEEAGTELILVNTGKHKPSQTCPACGAVRKKALSERVHTCASCGFSCGRDEAAAMNLLRIGETLARDRAGVAAQATSPMEMRVAQRVFSS
jgi:putative transposase